MRQSAVSFEADGLTFEGVVAQPNEGTGPWPGVVICHPHPLHGGNMDNNVGLALALGLAQEGFVTLRFNFRGVGGSQGEHTKGERESEEVRGAIDLIKAWPDTFDNIGLDAELTSFNSPPEFKLFDGVDHFWYGQEARLVPEVSRFLNDKLQ